VKRIANYFLQGLLFLAPIAVTLYTFVWAFRTIDSWIPFEIPGLGFLVLIVGITLVGFVVSSFFAGRMARLVDRVFQQLPLAKLIYGAVKDLLSAFVGERRRFKAPVAVELGPRGPWLLGFVTRESMEHFGLDDLVAVYVPQSYALAGHTLLVPRARIKPLSVDSADVMSFVVSGGVTETRGP
jgi:uncharacterized membrane protein